MPQGAMTPCTNGATFYNETMTPHTQTDLHARVARSLLSLGLADGRPLLLMVSGGSDSVALLQLTRDFFTHTDDTASAGGAPATGGIPVGGTAATDGTAAAGNAASANGIPAMGGTAAPLLVLHVNHLLRGSDADADEHFVVRLCAGLGIGCIVEREDVAALAAATGEGTEQAGRRLRYRFAEAALDAFSKELGVEPAAGRILTAHTSDDRAETLLQRLIVGGGGNSLSSIPRRNGRIVRPLLDCTREELRDWLTESGNSVEGSLWREDATNLDTNYSRAFVRHELLPLLAKRNPQIVEGLNRTAEVLSDESAWMDQLASELLPLRRESFAAPLPLVRRAVYLACNQAISELAPGARVTFRHIDLIVNEGSRNGFACQIPGGIEVRTRKGSVYFKKAKPPRHDPRA